MHVYAADRSSHVAPAAHGRPDGTHGAVRRSGTQGCTQPGCAPCARLALHQRWLRGWGEGQGMQLKRYRCRSTRGRTVVLVLLFGRVWLDHAACTRDLLACWSRSSLLVYVMQPCGHVRMLLSSISGYAASDSVHNALTSLRFLLLLLLHNSVVSHLRLTL